MVQRKVLSKLGIHDHVISEKSLSSPQHQDGKGRKNDIKKKSKKSRSINLSDLEALQSPSPRWSLSQPGKEQPPLCAPTAASSSLQKHKPLVRIDGSPNYMKPTSSSDAKKESFPVSLRNTQKNLPQRCSSSSRASSFSCKKQEKPLTRSSSSNLVRSLTKTTSFKPYRTSPRKSTAMILHAEMNPPVRATCSSTLKDSRFPAHLTLNPGGNEYEGTSVTKVCPYKYCSLNGHYHAPLSSLKSFVSAKRHILKTQKSMKLETMSPQRMKQCQTDSNDVEQTVLNGKHAHNEAYKGNPITTALTQKGRMDFFIEIYVKIKEGADDIDMDKFYSAEDLEEQDDIKSVTEEDGVKCVIQTINHALPKCEIDHEDDFRDSIAAAAIEADKKGSSHREKNAAVAYVNHSTSWFGEEICMGSYSSEASYDGEQMHNIEFDGCHSQDADDVELDGSGYQDTDIQWKEEEQSFSFSNGENIDYFFTEEESDSKFESLSESSPDVSVMWLDDILANHHADILVEGTLREANDEKDTYFEAQPHGSDSVLEGTCESMELETQENDYLSNGVSYDQLPPTDNEAFQHLTDVEDRENENYVSENCKVEESYEDSDRSLQNNDEGISQDNQIHPSEVPEESNIVVQDHELLEEDQGNTSKLQCRSCIGGEDLNTSKKWPWETKCKRLEQDDEQIRKIKPRKPNFLPLVPEPEPEKVSLKHQIMDERKDAEEWMLDYALRQAVTQLAPARKTKVALLVEAYETVMSLPKCESHNSPFAHAKPIQACS